METQTPPLVDVSAVSRTEPVPVALSTQELSIIHWALEARTKLYLDDGMADHAAIAQELAKTFARLHIFSFHGDTVTLTRQTQT